MRIYQSKSPMTSFTSKVNGVTVDVTLWGIDSIVSLSSEDQTRIHEKIARIERGRREWGTDHVGNTPITIRVQRRI